MKKTVETNEATVYIDGHHAGSFYQILGKTLAEIIVAAFRWLYKKELTVEEVFENYELVHFISNTGVIHVRSAT